MTRLAWWSKLFAYQFEQNCIKTAKSRFKIETKIDLKNKQKMLYTDRHRPENTRRAKGFDPWLRMCIHARIRPRYRAQSLSRSRYLSFCYFLYLILYLNLTLILNLTLTLDLYVYLLYIGSQRKGPLEKGAGSKADWGIESLRLPYGHPPPFSREAFRAVDYQS